VAGQEVTLSNGKRVKPDEVLGPLQKGLKLVVIGDTGKTDDLLDACKDADALVIESTYLNEEAEMAREFSHLTAQQAAELAVKANVKKLILTHISRRYREKDVLKEAQAIHPDVSVARDFDTFTIKRDEQDGQD
jgi:ribonuclease Z